MNVRNMLPVEPNARRAALMEHGKMAMASIMASAIPAVFFSALIHDGASHFTAALVIWAVSMLLLAVVWIWCVCGDDDLFEAMTPRQPMFMREAVGDMARMLVRLSNEGLTPRERPAAQRVLDQGARALHDLMGEAPWLAAARADYTSYGDNLIVFDENDHPASIGAQLQLHLERLAALGERPHGTGVRVARRTIHHTLPAMTAIARAFDLDVSGLAPTDRILPGMSTARPVLLGDMAGHVHQLAERWASSSNRDVDPMLRMDADAAAGRDLRDLERVWAAARASSAPEDVKAVDESYKRSTDALAATLSAALEAASKADADALTTHSGYIAAKHGSASDPVPPPGWNAPTERNCAFMIKTKVGS